MSRSCLVCGRFAHAAETCFKCGDPRHFLRDCPKRLDQQSYQEKVNKQSRNMTVPPNRPNNGFQRSESQQRSNMMENQHARVVSEVQQPGVNLNWYIASSINEGILEETGIQQSSEII